MTCQWTLNIQGPMEPCSLSSGIKAPLGTVRKLFTCPAKFRYAKLRTQLLDDFPQDLEMRNIFHTIIKRRASSECERIMLRWDCGQK